MTGGYRVIIVAEQSTAIREFWIGRSALQGFLVAFGLVALVPVAVGISAARAGGAPASAPAGGNPGAATPSSTNTESEPTRIRLAVGLGDSGRRFLKGMRVEAAPTSGVCGEGMALVEGAHCPVIHQRCLRYLDPEGSALYSQRCAEFESPTRCLSPTREQLRYCIDIDERTEEGGRIPRTGLTAADAQQACERAGRRLCTEKEWIFACEGEAISPYPYGFSRDSSLCNADQSDLVAPDGTLVDRRAASGAHPQCKSVFGVRNLSGNVEEYVSLSSKPGGFVRKGAYWQPGANTCRTSQAHPELGYRGVELGFRCCSDAPANASVAGVP